tara:strand:- start:599 stop:835 length:237 start_codon:yes stop_codon:yes gene_type:complete
MDNFIKKKDREIIEERVKITSIKVNERKRFGGQFLSHEENLRSYVRVQFLLGEPCWGDYSPVNNFGNRILNKIRLNSI